MQEIILLAEEGYRTHFWYSDITRGINEQAFKKKYSVAYHEVYLNGTPIGEQLDGIVDDMPVAVVLGYSYEWLSRISEYLYTRQCPVVYTYMYVSYPGLSHSYIDWARGEIIQDYIAYYTGCGKTRLALYGLKPSSIVDIVKVRYMRSTMESIGLPFGADDIYYLQHSFADTGRLFLEHAARYDAVICANDITAVHLVKLLQRHGIRVPEDLFVSGFSNSMLGRMNNPSLTTTTLSFSELGRNAVEAYSFLLRHRGENITLSITLPSRIIVRESTGSIPFRRTKPVFAADTDAFYDSYYNDPDATAFFNLEQLLQQSDEVDFGIIERLLGGVGYEETCAQLSISESTLKYRVKKMRAQTGTASKDELVEVLAKFLGEHH